ncbi:MAG: anhydro-N-acetylmuramic acid kinase, partial [Phycisphaerales bacterium]|nr:anhydro-N-acetylmuramic acid kinase [Phycisphaerales bacterium]
PAVVAAALDCDVMADLRAADLAEGGQGAPITPLADWLLMRDRSEAPSARAIINLGGFCNVTVLPAGAPPESVAGFDVCLCNQLLDHACRSRTGQPFDAGGARAMRGGADAAASARIAQHLASQRGAGRSLGSADECIGLADLTAGLEPDDALATVADAVARAIAEAVGAHAATRWFAAGGGTMNEALMQALARHASARGASLATTASIGVAPQAREALAMAALGAAAQDGACITLDAVTGRQGRRVIDGTLTRSHRIFTIGATFGDADCG